MSDRPTPETDAHLLGGSYSLDGEFARNLERQRDEAREHARELRDVLESAEAMLCKQESELRSLGADEPCAECAILDSRLALAKAKEVIP